MFDRMSAGTAFMLFAVGIALRDILTERLFSEDWLCLVFVSCATIAGASGLILVLRGSRNDLASKLSQPGVASRVFLLSTSALAIYAVTFYMIAGAQVAALFDLVDYGIAPLLTAALGIAFFRERFRANLAGAAVIFVVGLVLMKYVSNHPRLTLTWFLIALISPIATAASDAVAKWLLSDGQLSREQLLFCRFAPMSLLLFIYIASRHEGGVHLNNPVGTIVFYLVLGFGPLYLLCTGLGKAALSRFAAFEAVIPALVFAGSLPWQPTNQRPWAIVGAALVLVSMLVAEGSLLRRVKILRPAIE